MTSVRRWFFLGLVLIGTQLSTGCYLGYTNRPVLFPGVAYAPSYARAGVANPCGGCGPTCYREFGPGGGCGGSLFPGAAGYVVGAAPVVSGPVYDLPVSGVAYPQPAGTPGCVGCGPAAGGIPIAGTPGGPPIAVTPPVGGGPLHGIPFDSGTVPTLKPPAGSIPLQMPSEVKESKKLIAAGK